MSNRMWMVRSVSGGRLADECIAKGVVSIGWGDIGDLSGYKVKISEPDPDRGVDVMASPDGFGFESPRIMVEVKHREIRGPRVNRWQAAVPRRSARRRR